MCFNTTASNTGRFHGACVLLEQLIGRNLLWMACRHHIFEVLLSDVFTICLGPSTGPEILFFKRLRDHWGKLQHQPKQQLTPLILASDSLKQFILTQLTIVQPRADYKESATGSANNRFGDSRAHSKAWRNTQSPLNGKGNICVENPVAIRW